MRKTLLVTLDFFPNIGGAANYYYNLYLNLEANKIAVLADGNGQTGEMDNIWRRKLLARYFWPRWLKMIYEIILAVRREKAEIIWAGELLPTGSAVFLAAKFLHLPYIVSCHGKDVLMAKKNLRKAGFAKVILKNAMKVTANSLFTGKLIGSLGVKDGQIEIIYPGVEPSHCEAKREPVEILKKYGLENKKIIFTISRLIERKGVDNAILAYGDILKIEPMAALVIGGDGPDRPRLEKIARQAGGQIIFLGKISDNEKWQLMNIMDVFIMPTRESWDDAEGFGIVYLEAAVCGKPSIAGLAGGAAEAVIDGETGLLVDGNNINEISTALKKLLADNDLRRMLGENARARTMSRFNWKDRSLKFSSILK